MLLGCEFARSMLGKKKIMKVLMVDVGAVVGCAADGRKKSGLV